MEVMNLTVYGITYTFEVDESGSESERKAAVKTIQQHPRCFEKLCHLLSETLNMRTIVAGIIQFSFGVYLNHIGHSIYTLEYWIICAFVFAMFISQPKKW